MNGKNVKLHEATHISGSLLYHVYANNQSLQQFSVDKTEKGSIYFFDHDVGKFRVQNKYWLNMAEVNVY